VAPDRVVAVVGVGAGLGGFDGDSTPEELELFTEMDRLESLDPPDPAAVAEIDVRVWVDGPGQPPTRVPSWIREAVRAGDAPLYVESHVSGQRVRLDPPAAERLAELRAPVLAIAGALDVSDVAQAARHLEANAPEARALVWPDVAHMIGMEVPERLADAIVAFVAPLPRWA
jgi:3-oxoadipate enol-lactonase